MISYRQISFPIAGGLTWSIWMIYPKIGMVISTRFKTPPDRYIDQNGTQVFCVENLSSTSYKLLISVSTCTIFPWLLTDPRLRTISGDMQFVAFHFKGPGAVQMSKRPWCGGDHRGLTSPTQNQLSNFIHHGNLNETLTYYETTTIYNCIYIYIYIKILIDDISLNGIWGISFPIGWVFRFMLHVSRVRVVVGPLHMVK